MNTLSNLHWVLIGVFYSREGIPLQWCKVKFSNMMEYEKAVNEIKFPVFKHNYQSRLLPNDRNILNAKSDTNIFVKFSTEKASQFDNEDIFKIFSKFGEITCLKVSKTASNEGGFCATHNGYAFVNFKDGEHAKKALEETKEHGNDFSAEIFSMEKKKVGNNNLYVKDFPTSWSEADMIKLFSEFGELGSIKIITDEESKSKGFGFVCFKNFADAKSALDGINGREFTHEEDGKKEKKPIYVGSAQKKADRMKALKKAMSRHNLYVRNFDKNTTED